MANELLGKKLPFSVEAEQAVIGSILIDPECINEITGLVKADDFYMPEHESLFSAISSMFASSKTIDEVTLIDRVIKDGTYSDPDTLSSYLRTIIRSVPSAENAKDYAKIVHEKHLLRRLIETCSEISDFAYTEQDEVKNILDSAEQKIFDIVSGNQTKGFVHIRDVLKLELDNLNALSNDEGDMHGTPTGLSDLDNVLIGMGKTDLILIGARPGMGKTSFALNIATNVAKSTKKTVCIFSLEMSKEELVARMLSSEGLVDSKSIRSGKLSPDDWKNLAHASAGLAETDILIDDTTGLTATEMKAKLRRVKNLGLVVIDYLQLMQSDRRNDNRVQEVAEISRNMKIMAKELQAPVICCAQLSRGPENRPDKRPMLSDLRDSGAIEQDADVVMFLYRDEYYKDKDDNQSIAEVIVAKNRHGETKKVPMAWLASYTKFTSLIKDEPSLGN